MFEYYHDKLNEIWGAKPYVKNLRGPWPPGSHGSATYAQTQQRWWYETIASPNKLSFSEESPLECPRVYLVEPLLGGASIVLLSFQYKSTPR